MTSENQPLLDAIRTIVVDTIAPLRTQIETLTERIDALTELTERVDALTQRVDALEAEQRQHRELLRLLLERSGDLSDQVISVRTQQYAFEERLIVAEERVEKGFRALKDDLTLFFKDLQTTPATKLYLS